MRLRGRTSPLKGESVFTDFADLSAARHALVTRQGTTEEINSPESSLTLRAIPLVRGGKLFQLVLVLTERTEIRRKEEELQVKHSVIKEIHHRVKIICKPLPVFYACKCGVSSMKKHETHCRKL